MKIILIISLISLSFLCKIYEMKCMKNNQYCNCDEKCLIYADCCFGHKNFNKTTNLHKTMNCKLLKPTTGESIWVVNKCKKKNNRLDNLCKRKEIYSKFPVKSYVPVISKTGLIYENAFCAFCNNQTEFEYLNISINCANKNITDIFEANQAIKTNGNSCEIQPEIDDELKRFCPTKLIDFCPNSFIDFDNDDDNFTGKCLHGKESYAIHSKTLYKNIYCCKCWGIVCRNTQISKVNSVLDMSTFSYLLNFNDWIESERSIKLEKADNSTDIHNKFYNEFIFYLSYVFTCLSILSLSILITLYTTQKTFHNFGGYLTICLSICLWLLNAIILLVQNSFITNSSFCKYLGIIQHFIGISNFIWMAVYALDLLQTFGFKSINLGKRKNWKTFCLYCIIGFSCSAAIVTISVILEFTMETNSTLRPRYGGKHCWFNNKISGIIWYFIPVCLLLLWNLGTCILVFYRLMKTAKECEVIQNNESNSTLWLCIRLTAVFGFGYIFEIIAILTSVETLIIIGSIINCLQGCFLTCCFIWTKRVRSVFIEVYVTLTESLMKSSEGNSKFKEKDSIKNSNDISN